MKGKVLVRGLVLLVCAMMFLAPNVIAEGPCTADFDCDLDVDADDVTEFLAQFGREPYYDPCPTIPCPITCDGTLSALGRWCDQGDGTVKDMTTGLVWLKDAGWGGQKPLFDCEDWDDAHIRASRLWDGSPWEGTAGLSDGSVEGDWRLPTLNELEGITVGDEYIRSSQMYFFTGVQSNYYWSSTTYFNFTTNVWIVYMYSGLVDNVNKDYYGFYAWPVRGGR